MEYLFNVSFKPHARSPKTAHNLSQDAQLSEIERNIMMAIDITGSFITGIQNSELHESGFFSMTAWMKAGAPDDAAAKIKKLEQRLSTQGNAVVMLANYVDH